MRKLFFILPVLLWCNISGAIGSGCYVHIDIDTDFDGNPDILQGFTFTLNEIYPIPQSTIIIQPNIKKTCTPGTNDAREHSNSELFVGCVNPEDVSHKPITIVAQTTLRLSIGRNSTSNRPSTIAVQAYVSYETTDNNEITTHKLIEPFRYTSFQLGKIEGREGEHGKFVFIDEVTIRNSDLEGEVGYFMICEIDTSRTDVFETKAP